jgi:hypothetical protein
MQLQEASRIAKSNAAHKKMASLKQKRKRFMTIRMPREERSI